MEARPRSMTPLVVYTLATHIPDLQYYDDYCEWGHYQVIFETVDSYPTDDDQFRDVLKSSISAYAATGVKHFHLIGDASDDDEFDGSKTPEYWPMGFWENLRQSRLADDYPAGGQPSLDVIPTFYIKDHAVGDANETKYWPYYATDQPYADTEGADGLPDVVVTRWPVGGPANGRTELLLIIVKFLVYDGLRDPSGSAVRTQLFANNWDGTSGQNGEFVAAIADSLASALNGTTLLAMGGEHGTFGMYESTPYALMEWNENKPNVAIILGTGSHRLAPGEWFSRINFHPFSLDSGLPCVTVAPTCDTANWANTERTLPAFQGNPVCEGFLFQANFNEGAIAWIGPTSATWELSHKEVAMHVLKELYADRERSMAESWMTGLRSAVEDNLWKGDVASTSRKYAFLGDPVSRLQSNSAAATGVLADGQYHGKFDICSLGRNPTQDWVEIEFIVPTDGLVDVNIYDVTGRRVRSYTLNGATARRNLVKWELNDERGRRVGAGTYFVRGEFGRDMRTCRITVTR